MSGEKKKSSNVFPVVGVGASAGGLEAFKQLLGAIPPNSGMAFVLVQHLDPKHDSMLPEILQKATTIPVVEITDEIKVQPDHIYILPSNKMMEANDGVLCLTPRLNTLNTRNLPIDLFFKSLAEVHQSNAIGVVLSGAASDGTMGLKAIKESGGITFAQDEETAAYPSMPNSAINAGVVDFILPPNEIPQKLAEVTAIISPKPEDENTTLKESEIFKQVLSVLRVRTGTDFTHYKHSTLLRRILRRIAISKQADPAGYLKYLRGSKEEQEALYSDLLIPVSSFFRDPQVFNDLFKSVFPHIAEKTARETIRVWVAGCSTGEEAYSLAICLREYLADNHPKVQIFATDLNEHSIAKARRGIYKLDDLYDVSPERLKNFFTKTDGHYRVNKDIRDMCLFTPHNFLKDPPFGRMDMISCRNVLIYMEAYLQKRAITTFHYALNPQGFLLLGKSESIGSMTDLFAVAAKQDRLFTRKDVPGRFMHLASQRREQITIQPDELPGIDSSTRIDFQKSADDIILGKYTPTGVVVDEDMEIVHFRGNTSYYLEQLSGKPSHNLLKMAKAGLSFELRNILHKAKKEKGTVVKENIPIQVNGTQRNITLEAMPLPNTIHPHYLVLFHDPEAEGVKPMVVSEKKKASAAKATVQDKDLLIQHLEQQLMQNREDMRIITEDQEAANEELQSANEELLSSSEELQSLNEELETSSEELQSTNEELTVVNQEMVGLNEEVTKARDYAEAIVATMSEPLVVLDKNLVVKTANVAFYKTFMLNERDTQGRLIYEIGNKEWDIPALRNLLEKILPEKEHFNAFEVSHNFRSIGERTMLLNAREITKEARGEKLILLAISDVTNTRIVEKNLQKSEAKFRQLADFMPQKVWTADEEGNLNYFNKNWLDYTGLSFEDLKDWGWKQIIHPDDWEFTKTEWQRAIDTGNNFEAEHRFLNADGSYKWHLSRGIAYKNEKGKVNLWVGTNTLIHAQKKQKEDLEKAVMHRTYELQQANQELEVQNEKLEQMNVELHSFAYVASHDLQEPLRKIQTFAERVIKDESSNLSGKGKDYFSRMQDAAKRMQTLIEDLLAFSRTNTTERRFETIDLNVLVEEVKEELKETILQKKATIETGPLCPANVIVFQFRQLLQNLIGNALKFSQPDIPPHIVIKSRIVKGSELNNPKLIAEKQYCHISVKDNGIGFEPHFSKRIFEVFQKLHGRGEYAGTGIGLAIVKKIVENHNGIITATSELGKGATFDIYMPTE